MSITLAIGDGQTVKINGNEYNKNVVQLDAQPNGKMFDFIIDGNRLGNTLYSAILDGDDSDTAFTSGLAVAEWWDKYGQVYRAEYSPFRLVSAATTNDTLVKSGRTSVKSIRAINVTEANIYLKVYDLASAPTSSDTPVMTVLLPPQSEDIQFEVEAGFGLWRGLGLRLTANVGDADETAISAGDVIINILYK